MAATVTWPPLWWWQKFYVTPDGCWIWTGCRKRDGYGQTGVKAANELGEKNVHRVVYRLLVGPIPAGLVLDHLCHVKLCANPAHVEPVTPQENRRRAPARGKAKHRYIRL